MSGNRAYRLVPVEPTREMIAAGDMLTYQQERFKASEVYRTMVDAVSIPADVDDLCRAWRNDTAWHWNHNWDGDPPDRQVRHLREMDREKMRGFLARLNAKETKAPDMKELARSHIEGWADTGGGE